jgi:nucleotide-binding universal stress UspA family protein
VTEIRSILAAVDFSTISSRALEHAAQLAKWFEATLTILHVSQPPIPLPPELYGVMPAPMPAAPLPASELPEADVVTALKRFASAVPSTGVDVRFRVRSGVPLDQILAEAKEIGSDLIVMGTHGHTGFDRLVLGSVAEKVLRKARCAVLTVPPPVTDAPSQGLGLFKRILCPLDFSDASLEALEYVFPLAKEADADVILVHVIEGVPESAGLRVTLTSTFTEHLRALEEDALKRLQAAVPDDARPWCRPSTLLLRGKPYQEILRVAQERDVRLIVMGVHGRSAIDRLFFGSTTSHVVRNATCPVMTLKM